MLPCYPGFCANMKSLHSWLSIAMTLGKWMTINILTEVQVGQNCRSFKSWKCCVQKAQPCISCYCYQCTEYYICPSRKVTDWSMIPDTSSRCSQQPYGTFLCKRKYRVLFKEKRRVFLNVNTRSMYSILWHLRRSLIPDISSRCPHKLCFSFDSPMIGCFPCVLNQQWCTFVMPVYFLAKKIPSEMEVAPWCTTLYAA